RAFVEDSEPAFAVGLAPLDRDLTRRVMERVLDQVVEQDRHVFLGGGNRDVPVAAQLERAAFPLRTRSPARLGALRGPGQRDRPRNARLVALAREREQRREQAREPLDLELCCLQLAGRLGARLPARGL